METKLRRVVFVAIAVLAMALLVGCGQKATPTPVVMEVTREVEKIVKETVVVKEAVEVQKEVTRVVEKIVEKPVQMTQPTAKPTNVPVTATSVVSPTSAIAASSLSPTVTMTSTQSGCRHELWLSEAISGTVGTSELVAVLDRDYVPNEGGQWSEAGYSVPAGSIFWTDLFQNVLSLPKGVVVVRAQGGWGVYRNSVPYIVPRPNGGGRFMRICEGNLAAATPVPTASVVSVAPTAVITHTCISRIDVGVIIGKADYVAEYNRFFEGRGYSFGTSVAANGKVPSGTFFLGTLGATIPAGAKDLKGGFLWEISQEVTSPKGGRWMRICK